MPGLWVPWDAPAQGGVREAVPQDQGAREGKERPQRSSDLALGDPGTTSATSC